MNTHDKYELPPLFLPGAIGKYTKKEMQDYARAAIEPYAKRIAELEADRKRRGEPVAWPPVAWWDGSQGPAERLAESLEGYAKIKPGASRDVWAMKAAAKWIRAVLATPQPAEPNEWKQAVDDELTSIDSTADSFPSAKEAVKALVDWHVSVATDPAFQPAKPVNPLPKLVVTKGGVPFEDQNEGIRQFKEACMAEPVKFKVGDTVRTTDDFKVVGVIKEINEGGAKAFNVVNEEAGTGGTYGIWEIEHYAEPMKVPSDDIHRDASGETWMGMRVAAWQWKEDSPIGKLTSHATHWSTGPKDAERLYRESDIRALLARYGAQDASVFIGSLP